MSIDQYQLPIHYTLHMHNNKHTFLFSTSCIIHVYILSMLFLKGVSILILWLNKENRTYHVSQSLMADGGFHPFTHAPSNFQLPTSKYKIKRIVFFTLSLSRAFYFIMVLVLKIQRVYTKYKRKVWVSFHFILFPF